MSALQPVGVWALRVPASDVLVPGCLDAAAMFRVTMAALDPSAEPEITEGGSNKPPRATLKIVRVPDDEDSEDSEDDEDDEMLNGLIDEADDSSDEEHVNGGPSSRKSKKAKLLEAIKQDEAESDEDMVSQSDSEEDAEAEKVLKQLMSGKGKAKALDGGMSSSDSDDEDETLEMEEVVLCTLDADRYYQQPLDLVICAGERVFFKVTGTHEIHLTGQYVMPIDDNQASLYDDIDEDEYDLSPGEEEDLSELEDDGESEDELDDLEDPRITELEADEDTNPSLVKPAVTKGKNKRAATDSEDEDEAPGGLDDMMAKDIEDEQTPAPATNGEVKKLTKAEKRKMKKLKKNDGEAAPVETSSSTIAPPSSEPKQKTPEPKKEPLTNGTSNGSEKKVQFAKNLEQGPTPSAAPPVKAPEATKKPATGTLGIREVQGMQIDERKLGSGTAAKKGSRVDMRYIGKLEDGKVFDSNKSGKPFSFKLGTGAVIKGWDVGLEGIAAGGERRLIIPASLGYGKKGAPPDIPPNAKLTFDVKCLSVK